MEIIKLKSSIINGEVKNKKKIMRRARKEQESQKIEIKRK